jgi:DNA repair photolyase
MHYADYKTILSPKNGINLYRGCTHGCIYCDSRSACYQMNHAFEDIEIKRNAPEILEEQLKKRRSPGMISTGAMTDPYIHLEERFQYTRQCLKLVEKYGFGISILTKSNRILRDLDLLERIHQKTKCVVQITLTTYNEDLCRIVEPHVSSTFERFQVLEQMRDRGIPTIVWLGPILPFINDHEENLLGLLDYCRRAKVHGILCFGFGLTLREGNREYFYEQLDEKLDPYFPGIKQKYMRTFGKAYSCGSPNHERLFKIFKAFCLEHQILYKPNDIWAYLAQFEAKTPAKSQQLSLF